MQHAKLGEGGDQAEDWVVILGNSGCDSVVENLLNSLFAEKAPVCSTDNHLHSQS